MYEINVHVYIKVFILRKHIKLQNVNLLYFTIFILCIDTVLVFNVQKNEHSMNQNNKVLLLFLIKMVVL